MAGGNIQYGWYEYWDDDGTRWSVALRKRAAQVGNFGALTFEEFTRSPKGGNVWPYQRLAMRHVTVKTADGKILKFPCQKTDSANYNNVGGTITISIWDTGIDDGAPPSATIEGKIISRTGERLHAGPFYPQYPGTPA